LQGSYNTQNDDIQHNNTQLNNYKNMTLSVPPFSIMTLEKEFYYTKSLY